MNGFLTRLAFAAATAIALTASTHAQVTVDITGWQAQGLVNDPTNSSTTIAVPAGAAGVTSFVYANLDIATVGAFSWCSDFRMRVEIPGSSFQFIDLLPTGAPDATGTYFEPGPGTVAGGGPFAIPAGTTQLRVFVYATWDEPGVDISVVGGSLTVDFGTPPPPPPGCTDATTAIVGSTPFQTSGAGVGQLVTTNAAGDFTTTIYGPQWFKFTPTETGYYELSVCGSAGDTKMAIGAACPEAETVPMVSLGYNDDSCECSSGCGGNYSSRLNLTTTGLPLTAQLQAGTTYRILVGGYGATTGAISGELVIATFVPPPPPAGCTDAAAVVVGSTPFQTEGGSVGQLVTSNAAGTTTSTIYGPQWFKFTPAQTSYYEISVCGSAGDTKIAIGAACPTSEGVAMVSLGYNNDSCACSSGCGGNYSSRLNLTNTGAPLAAQLQAGTTYRILVGGFGGTTGPVSGNLVISTIAPPPPPNTCANPVAAIVGANTVMLDPAAAPIAVACAAGSNLNKPGYLRFVPPETRTYAIGTAGTTDTVMVAMTACGNAATIIACNDNACGGTRSEILLPATQGTPVFIAVGLKSATAVPPATGITVNVGPAIAANTCDTPLTGAVGVNRVGLDPSGATLVDVCGTVDMNKPAYVRFVPPASGTYEAKTCGTTTLDTVIAALSECGNVSSVLACDDDLCDPGLQSQITFEGVAGTPVFIAVGLWSATACPPAEGLDVIITGSGPPLDPCAPENVGTAVIGNNQVVPDPQYPALDTSGSTCVFDFGAQAIARAKYLRFNPPVTGLYLFEQCADTGTGVDGRMALLTTCGDASTLLICDDDGCTGGQAPFTSKFEYTLTAGQEVFLVVGGYDATVAGPLNVLISGPGAGQCIPDLNNDQQVNGDDLGILLTSWGPCTGCAADFDGNGAVNGDDLGQLLTAWGPCP